MEKRAAQPLNKVIKPEFHNKSKYFYPLQHFFPFLALHNLPAKDTDFEQDEYILWTK